MDPHNQPQDASCDKKVLIPWTRLVPEEWFGFDSLIIIGVRRDKWTSILQMG